MAKSPFLPLERVQKLAPYVPGLSITEIQQRYDLPQVIKMASNENPLGMSPLAQEAVIRCAASGFRYPQSGNPRLTRALAQLHGVAPERIVVGNGSDEIIDMLIRMYARPERDAIVTFQPCFGIYVSQAAFNGVERRTAPLNDDFSHNYHALLQQVSENTPLVFITTPDNPSGYCPDGQEVRELASGLAAKNPRALLVVDEAYMDFHPDEENASLLAHIPDNVIILRTFSKSYGLAGMRVGYAIAPAVLAESFWRARLPFSVDILAEEAALAALKDSAFHEATLETVRQGRQLLTDTLRELGCTVWPSSANFLMFRLPAGHSASGCNEFLLRRGIIIRGLKSYGLPDHLRVTIGNQRENQIFLEAVKAFLHP